MGTAISVVAGVIVGVVFKSWIMQLAKKVVTLVSELVDWTDE